MLHFIDVKTGLFWRTGSTFFLSDTEKAKWFLVLHFFFNLNDDGSIMACECYTTVLCSVGVISLHNLFLINVSCSRFEKDFAAYLVVLKHKAFQTVVAKERLTAGFIKQLLLKLLVGLSVLMPWLISKK